MRFRFRLERVLNFRQTERKDRERELALKNRELLDAESRLNSIVEAQDRTNHPGETVSMAELGLTGDYQKLLREALVNQRLLVLEATSAVDAARQAYIEKAIEAETLQTLRQQRFEEHRVDEKRRERKELNEIATQRHQMKKENGDG